MHAIPPPPPTHTPDTCGSGSFCRHILERQAHSRGRSSRACRWVANRPRQREPSSCSSKLPASAAPARTSVPFPSSSTCRGAGGGGRGPGGRSGTRQQQLVSRSAAGRRQVSTAQNTCLHASSPWAGILPLRCSPTHQHQRTRRDIFQHIPATATTFKHPRTHVSKRKPDEAGQQVVQTEAGTRGRTASPSSPRQRRSAPLAASRTRSCAA